jgi:hypothetical protein
VIFLSKIKLISEANKPVWISTVGKIFPGMEFEIDEKEAQEQRLEQGPFKRSKSPGRPKKIDKEE